MGIEITSGAKLYFNTNLAATKDEAGYKALDTADNWTEFKGVEMIDRFGDINDEFEVDLLSESRTKNYSSGVSGGKIKVTFHVDDAAASGQPALQTAIGGKYGDGADLSWKIVYPTTASGGSGKTKAFDGPGFNYETGEHSKKGNLKGTFDIAVNTAVVSYDTA